MDIVEIWQNWLKKRNIDYDFPPPFTNKFVGTENNNLDPVKMKRTVRTETHFSWRASRKELKRVSYTLQAAEPCCSVTNGRPI